MLLSRNAEKILVPMLLPDTGFEDQWAKCQTVYVDNWFKMMFSQLSLENNLQQVEDLLSSMKTIQTIVWIST